MWQVRTAEKNFPGEGFKIIMNSYKYIFRLALWGSLFGVVVWLVYMSVVPSGQIIYRHDFKKDNYHIGRIGPDTRVEYKEYDGSYLSFIKGDPAYFNLRTPRNFDTALLKIRYKRSGNLNLPLVEAGVLVDSALWRYDLKPVENKILDQLALVWESIEEDGLILFKRIGGDADAMHNYDSIASFIENPPARDRIAAYNIDFNPEYEMRDYEPLKKNIEYRTPIRGNFQFYTYVGLMNDAPEKMYFKFKFSDQNKDADPVDLHLYYGDVLIDSRHLDDDGADDEKESVERELEFDLAGLPSGVYKIELRAGSDIITRSIETAQAKLSFINKIWLFDEGKKLSVFTDSYDINVQTQDPRSLQTIRFEGGDLEIKETYKQYGFKASGSPMEINFERSNLIMAGDGVFSFSKDSLLNPKLKRVNSFSDLKNSGVDYVLAKYIIPSVNGEWREAELEFDLKQAYRENGKYSFLISIPGLRAEDNVKNEGIIIRQIEFHLKGRTLKDAVRNFAF
jgi:hypothetical protein